MSLGKHKVALTVSGVIAVMSDPSLLHKELVQYLFIALAADWGRIVLTYWNRRAAKKQNQVGAEILPARA